METKRCTRCNEIKPASHFYPDKRHIDGLASHCSLCHGLFQKASNAKRRNNPPLIAIEKKCPCCKQIKCSDDFVKCVLRPDGLDSTCKDCRRNKYRLSVQTGFDPVLGVDVSSFRRRACLAAYGLTIDDFNKMAQQQKYLCAICHQPESKRRKGKLLNLNVDHNHSTNCNRGLLCSRCNLLIGRIDENIEILESAVKYLRRYNGGDNC